MTVRMLEVIFYYLSVHNHRVYKSVDLHSLYKCWLKIHPLIPQETDLFSEIWVRQLPYFTIKKLISVAGL